MANESSRRDFLKLSATGTAALAGAVVLPRLVAASATDPVGDLSVWVTDDTQRLKPGPAVAWKPASGTVPLDAVLLDPSNKFQEVLGFGGAFTDAACYTFNRLE